MLYFAIALKTIIWLSVTGFLAYSLFTSVGTFEMLKYGICLLAWLASFTIAMETIKYFGLPKNYVWATILAVVIAPLTIIFLSLVFSGVIPSIFDPRFL